MKRDNDGCDTMVSDSGHTWIVKTTEEGRRNHPELRPYAMMQHSIAECWLTDEDREMAKDPEGFWKRNES